MTCTNNKKNVFVENSTYITHKKLIQYSRSLGGWVSTGNIMGFGLTTFRGMDDFSSI